jgi:hypothetical protein
MSCAYNAKSNTQGCHTCDRPVNSCRHQHDSELSLPCSAMKSCSKSTRAGEKVRQASKKILVGRRSYVIQWPR